MRMKFLQGLTNREIARCLRVRAVTAGRVAGIVAALRRALAHESADLDAAKYLSAGGGV